MHDVAQNISSHYFIWQAGNIKQWDPSTSMWSMYNSTLEMMAPRLRSVKDVCLRLLCKETFESFETHVLSKLDQLREGKRSCFDIEK